MIDIGLFHHVEELARIGRQGFDITPLPFGIDRIEGERGFARPRQAGDHDKLVARNIHVDVLEVMFARAAHRDIFQLCHGSSLVQALHISRQARRSNGFPEHS
jgi:hypothetical protein